MENKDVMEWVDIELKNYTIKLTDKDKDMIKTYIKTSLELGIFYEIPADISNAIFEFVKVITICKHSSELSMIYLKDCKIDGLPII